VLDKPVLIVRRFDREAQTRIPFLSAMSMLGAKDNEPHSYLEIAYALAQHGSAPNQDTEELWRRIIFTILVSNTDDHLRNHGFLLTSQGWMLSPAYDINPNPHGNGLSLNISMDDNSLDYDLVLSIAPHFRLDMLQAQNHIANIKEVVSHWRNIALKLNISRNEIEDMTLAFKTI
jgi:serine/threonine-protein kinase HipA